MKTERKKEENPADDDRLQSFGADNGSRTRLCSLGSCRSTDELYPPVVKCIIADSSRVCNLKNVDGKIVANG